MMELPSACTPSEGFSGSQDTLLLVPTLNEVDNVQPLAEALVCAGFSGSVLWIDDGSVDGTLEVIEQVLEGRPEWRLLRRSGRKGLGRSYQDGFTQALIGEHAYVATMDADLSHRTIDLGLLLSQRHEADAVVGSRYLVVPHGVRGWPLHRLALSRWAGFYCNSILKYPMTDWTSGFKVLSRSCLEAVARTPFKAGGYSFQIELHHRILAHGLKLREVPIVFVERQRGQSKLSWSAITEASATVIVLRFR